MRMVRRLVSRAIYIRHGKILLSKSVGKSNFFLLGGEIEAYESAWLALLREIKEELNRDAEIVDFIGIIENNWVKGNVSIYETNFLFSINMVGNCFECISSEESLRFEWIPLANIDDIDIRPPCLKRYIKKISNDEFEALWFSNY